MRKKKFEILSLVLILTLVAVGCNRKGDPKEGEPYLYYINEEEGPLVKKAYDWKGENAREEVENILEGFGHTEDPAVYHSPMPLKVRVEKYTLEDGKLDLYFDEDYATMGTVEETLCRAALVQSFVQIDGVDMVKIYVGQEALTDKSGQEIGYMRAEDFVQNTGMALNSYQRASMTLFFANGNGDKLKREKREVRYSSNMSIEKVLVEQLIKGPDSGSLKATIPPETKLLGISVKEGICYVNFDEGFLMEVYDINPKITILSLVNTIIEGGNTSQVQISVNGKTDVVFHDVVDLSKPISRDLDIVEE